MADDSGDRSEKASEQKLRKAREQGLVARSRDLAAAIGLLLGLKLMLWMAPSWFDDFRRLFRLVLSPLPEPGLMDAWATELAGHALWMLLKMVLPLALLPLAVTVAAQLGGGIVFATSQWAPQFGRMNPLANLARLFSAKHYSDLGATLVKVAGLIVVLAYLVRSQAPAFVGLQALSLDEALPRAAGLLFDALLSLAAVLGLYALVDVPLQRLLFLRGQRMSKQEVKEEHKQNEGRPEVRQRMRQIRQQMARRSVRKAVPDADVIINNPEHYAVAVRYDSSKAAAPYVVAKGIDEMAAYIRSVAREHQVPQLELPPLARALYNGTQVQQQIPASLYEAVAQVLHHVMQLQAFRSGRRQTEPRLDADLQVPRHLSDPDTP
ncbi:flagellar type III secretion system protein FlhB [Roseateles sp. BYS78W]|uniref:Flagellar type III secretion system protein FlhB n=1 Tax=Pelomonas candidula TaxID=3299025 RepID=A0ABW7HGG5_9BURK